MKRPGAALSQSRDTGTVITPSPEHQFSEDREIILIGDEAAEKAFEVKFCPS